MLQLNGGQRYSFGVFATVIALIAFTSTFAGCKEKQIAMPAPVVIVTDTTHKDYDGASCRIYLYGFRR